MSDPIADKIFQYGVDFADGQVPTESMDLAEEIRQQIEAETVQRCIDAAKPILHSHIYKGTEETYEELKDAEQELIEALEAQRHAH